jgi:hypothetical protein
MLDQPLWVRKQVGRWIAQWDGRNHASSKPSNASRLQPMTHILWRLMQNYDAMPALPLACDCRLTILG